MKYVQPYGTIDDSSYVNGDPSIGRAGSIPPAAAFEHPQREIMHMVEKSGLVGVDTDLYQLLKSIRTQRVNYAIDVGTVNTMAVAFDPLLDGYTNGLVVRARAAFTNTLAATIDCGPGTRSIVRLDGSPLGAGDIVHGGIAILCYVDGEFQLCNPSFAAALAAVNVTGSPGVTGGSGTQYITNNFAGFQAMWAREAPGTYDWTVPGGVLKVLLRLWAGGGPGISDGGDQEQGGHGGYVEGVFDVVPGTLMRIVVGAGAAPPSIAYKGSEVGDIQFKSDVSAYWYNTQGQPSSFGPAGSPVVASATGGRGIYVSTIGDLRKAVRGINGVGTGGAINRANAVYGAGGGDMQQDNTNENVGQCTGGDGAAIIVY